MVYFIHQFYGPAQIMDFTHTLMVYFIIECHTG